MAAITLLNPTFYYQGQIVTDPWVSFTSTDYRIGRYEFTAPSEGANHVQLKFTQTLYAIGSNAEHHDFVFYIGTSSTSHTNANSTSPYTGQLTMTWANDGTSYSTFTGEADILLIPNTKYYVWIFSISSSSTRYTNYSFGEAIATATTSGAAGIIYIDNGGETTNSRSIDGSSITLSNPSFFYDGQSVTDTWVGSTNTNYRVARYEFTAPSEGASHIQLEITGTFFFNSDTDNTHAHNHNFCFYIGTSSSSHAAANSDSSYTGQLTMTWADDWTNASIFTGEADILLSPNTKYYVWIFSISELLSGIWAIYNFETATATITISGATGSTDNSACFEKYQVYIDNGTSWDLYIPYIDNGNDWDIIG